ncbi:hypothetical protein Tco_1022585 [Tanacetum coccineum]
MMCSNLLEASLAKKPVLIETNAFAIISREESHRGVASSSSGSVIKPQVSSFVAKSNSWNNNGNKKFDNNKRVGNSTNNRGPNPNLHFSSSSKKGASLSFTNEQMMKLMNLINEAPSRNVQANMAGRVTLGWIIDSGANQHMTISTLNMFGVIDITDLNLTVGHPNRTFE